MTRLQLGQITTKILPVHKYHPQGAKTTKEDKGRALVA